MEERRTRIVFARKYGEAFYVGDSKVTVIAPCHVRVVVEAMESVKVDRAEVREKIERERAE